MSYAEIVGNLSATDRKELAALGVPSSRISEWKTGFRYPTRPQVLALAEVKRIDPMELERELVMLETEDEAKKKPTMAATFRAMLNTLKSLLYRTPIFHFPGSARPDSSKGPKENRSEHVEK